MGDTCDDERSGALREVVVASVPSPGFRVARGTLEQAVQSG